MRTRPTRNTKSKTAKDTTMATVVKKNQASSKKRSSASSKKKNSTPKAAAVAPSVVSSSDESSVNSCVLHDQDVCCGRGKGSANHPGNMLYQRLIQENAPKYANSSSKNEKSLIVSYIVGEIYASGGRFVKIQEGAYVDIGKVKAHEKTGHSVRDHILHRQKKGRPVGVTPDPAPSTSPSVASKKDSGKESPKKARGSPKKARLNANPKQKASNNNKKGLARQITEEKSTPKQQQEDSAGSAEKEVDAALSDFESFFWAQQRSSSGSSLFDLQRSSRGAIPSVPVSAGSSFFLDDVDEKINVLDDIADACQILDDEEDDEIMHEEAQEEKLGDDLLSVFDQHPQQHRSSSVCWPVINLAPQQTTQPMGTIEEDAIVPLAPQSILPEDWM
jgi:hypothetical protein